MVMLSMAQKQNTGKVDFGAKQKQPNWLKNTLQTKKLKKLSKNLRQPEGDRNIAFFKKSNKNDAPQCARMNFFGAEGMLIPL